MEQLTAFGMDLLNSIKPLLQQYLEFLLPPMVLIIAVVYVVKKCVPGKGHKMLWRLLPLALGIAYAGVLQVMKPETMGLADKTDAVKIIAIIGIGLAIGAVNVVLYDAFKWWRKRKKANAA